MCPCIPKLNIFYFSNFSFNSVLFSVQSLWVETPGTTAGPASGSTGSEDGAGETNGDYWNWGSKGRWREREMSVYFFTESKYFL